MSLSVRELIKIAERQLADAGVADAQIDAKELYCFLMHYDKVALMMHWQDVLQDNQCEAYFALIEKRAERQPLQHIIGEQEFMGLPFKVNEHVLIPRQDTETMVEDAIEFLDKGTLRGSAYGRAKPLKGNADILDLCCGSGAIGISLAKTFGKSKVVCTDVSPQALETARENASYNGCKNVKFAESDMFEAPFFNSRFGKKIFDFIISNPPYIESGVIEGLEPEVKDHEPRMALDGGTDGLEFYRIIAEQAAAHLKKDGVLMLEIGCEQKNAVMTLLEQTESYENIVGLADLTGRDRIVAAIKKKEEKKRGV